MTPVGHSSLALLGFELIESKKNYLRLFFLVLLANFPDIDLIINFFLPYNLKIQHQLYTHNVFFVLLSVIILFPFFKSKRDRIVLFFIGYSHLILDLIVVDYKQPIGFKLFYPISDKFFNYGFFPTFYKANINEILSIHNLLVLLLEAMIFFVPVAYYFGKQLKNDIFNKRFFKL